MNVHFPASHREWPGRLANLAVAVVVLALAAATFVLSYPGVHAIVSQSGVSVPLARLYPGIFDALLVIASVAAVMLRDARRWARWYAWVVVVVVVAVVGAADVVHAMNVALPHRKTEGVVAAVPWVLVLLGFSLMLTMLSQSRAQHAAASAADDLVTPRRAARPAAELEAPAAVEAPPAPASAAPEAARPAEKASAPEAPELLEGADAVRLLSTEELALTPRHAATEHAAEAGARAPDAADTLQPAGTSAVSDDASPARDWEASDDTGPVRQQTVCTLDEILGPVRRGPAFAEEPEAVAREGAAAGQGHPTATQAAALPEYEHLDGDKGNGFPEDRHPAVMAGPVVNEDAPPPATPPATVPASVIDEDAPPFATAPFAAVPRLNRVRSTPTPPEDDAE